MSCVHKGVLQVAQDTIYSKQHVEVLIQNSAFCDIYKEKFTLMMKIINSISQYLKELLSK